VAWARSCSEVSCAFTGLARVVGFHCCVQCAVCIAIPYLVVLCQTGVSTFFQLGNGMPPICVQVGGWTGN